MQQYCRAALSHIGTVQEDDIADGQATNFADIRLLAYLLRNCYGNAC